MTQYSVIIPIGSQSSPDILSVKRDLMMYTEC